MFVLETIPEAIIVLMTYNTMTVISEVAMTVISEVALIKCEHAYAICSYIAAMECFHSH